MNLLLLEPEELDHPIPYNDHRARHVREVLRAQPGDTLAVGVVEGPKGAARIAEHSRESGLVLSDMHFQPVQAPTDSFYPVTMVIGHVRPIVLKRLLKDLTTIGVERIVIVPGELGEKSYLQSTMWTDGSVRRQLIEGASQGGVTCLPAVEKHYSLRRALAACAAGSNAEDGPVEGAPPEGGRVLRLHLAPTGTPIARVLTPAASAPGAHGAPAALEGIERAIVAVGPERGFTSAEEAELQAAGFEGVSLGSRILRTESAAVLAAGMVSRILVATT